MMYLPLYPLFVLALLIVVLSYVPFQADATVTCAAPPTVTSQFTLDTLIGCNIVLGDLTLSAPLDVSALDSVHTLRGQLRLANYGTLASFTALEFVDGLEIGSGSSTIFSFPALQKVDGNVYIHDATPLNILFPSLLNVTGRIFFQDVVTSSIDDLFYNLVHVGQEIAFHGFHISQMRHAFHELQTANDISLKLPSTTLLSAFQRLQTIQGDFIMEQCVQLFELPYLAPLLKVIEGDLHMSDFRDLVDGSLVQFASLEAVQGDIYLSLQAIDSIRGFRELTHVEGDLRFEGNYDVEFFHELSFNKLAEISGSLIMKEFISLETIESFNALEVVRGYVELYELDELQDILFLSNLRFIMTGPTEYLAPAISISYLPEITSLKGLHGLEAVGGDIEVISNANLCFALPFDVSKVANSYTVTQMSNKDFSLCSCYAPLPISTKADLLDLTGCRRILSDLEINSNEIENLNPLYGLIQIQGSLYLRDNTLLNDISGFKNCAQLTGSLYILNNLALERISNVGFGAVDSLVIKANPKLISTAGLLNLSQVRGTSGLYVFNGFSFSFFVYNNPLLVPLAALDSISVTEGSVLVLDNPYICYENRPSFIDLTTRLSFLGDSLNRLVFDVDNAACIANRRQLVLNGDMPFKSDNVPFFFNALRFAVDQGMTGIYQPFRVGMTIIKNLSDVFQSSTTPKEKKDAQELGEELYNRVEDFVLILDDVFRPTLANDIRLNAIGSALSKALDIIFHNIGESANCLETPVAAVLDFYSVENRIARLDTEQEFTGISDAHINVPQAVAEQIANLKGWDCVSFLFAVYKENPFEVPANNEVLSSIVSLKINDEDFEDLVEPVRMVVPFNPPLTPNALQGREIVCAFWSYPIEGWSTEGCVLVSHNNDAAICECTHLTHFAILFQLEETGNVLAMAIISYIGCTLSVVAASATIVTFVMFPRLKHNGASLTINLCAAIIAAQLLFLIGIDKVDNTGGCTAVAIMLHYFLMVMFTWMLVMSIHLYMVLVQLARHIDDYFWRYFICSWGAPFIVVGSLAIADWKSDGTLIDYGNHEICWIGNLDARLYAFNLPVLAMILVNLFIFVLIVVQIRRVQGAKVLHSKNDDKKGAKSQMKIFFSLFLLLGGTWILAYFAMLEDTGFFWIMFVACNSFQGALIFFHYCCNKRVLNAWKSWFKHVFRKRALAVSPSIEAVMRRDGNATDNTGSNSNTNATTNQSGNTGSTVLNNNSSGNQSSSPRNGRSSVISDSRISTSQSGAASALSYPSEKESEMSGQHDSLAEMSIISSKGNFESYAQAVVGDGNFSGEYTSYWV